MKNLYEKETMEHINDPVVQKYLKQIKLNKLLWILGAVIATGIAVMLGVLGGVVWHWERTPFIIGILVPSLIGALAIVMTIVIFLGNKVAVKTHGSDKITFYSGPNTNCLYVNDKLIANTSDDRKLTAVLADKSVLKVNLKTISFSIDVLPPGTVINQPVKPVEAKQETKKEEKKEESKPQA